MSCEENNAKRQCVETSDACTNSPPSSGAPIKSFRDLIFSVSGTMPASLNENSHMEQSAGQFSGKRKFNSDVDVDASAEEKSDGDDGRKCLAGIVNESDVGITEFISKHEGFSGILKQR